MTFGFGVEDLRDRLSGVHESRWLIYQASSVKARQRFFMSMVCEFSSSPVFGAREN